MLSLGPGSACDVCLEPFGTDLKAPCSIPCGHVFCVHCLHHLARPTCPLCRTPFDSRHTIKLHIDLDSIAAPLSVAEMPVPANTDERARQLQNRITQVAQSGATEVQTTELTEECKAFLAPLSRTMYSDLRTAYKMLSYMCHVKHLYIEQGRANNQYQRNITSLNQEVDRLKANIEALKIEKRRLDQGWQTASAERDSLASECEKLHEQLDNAESQMLLVTEQSETAQNQLVLLHEELQRLRSEGEFSSPEGEGFPPELPSSLTSDPYWSPQAPHLDPEPDVDGPARPFLTPWEHLADPKTLPDANLPQDPQSAPLESLPSMGGYCGAAGCPHSCNCMPFLLFSPASRAAAAASMGARLSTSDGQSMSDVLGGAPSSLSLSLAQTRHRSRSRSHSRPRSRSLSRASSPVNPIILTPPSASPMPPTSASMTIPNPHNELRGQLKDLLRDPPMSSSLPNMGTSHFLSSPLTREIRYPAPPQDRAAAPASSSRPRNTHLHPPMLSHSRNTSPHPPSTPLVDQRPPLYRTASGASSHTADEAQRGDRERRRAERPPATRPLVVEEPARPSPMPRPQSHTLAVPTSSSLHASPAAAPPMARPQAAQPSSRLPSPLLIPTSAETMPHAHAHMAALPPPSIPHPPRVHVPMPSPPTGHQPQPPAPPMQRAQAHALPTPAPPPTQAASSSRPHTHTKPSSPPLHAPAPPTYRAPPEIAAGSGERERVRRTDAPDALRGGYAPRGTSKRVPAAPTMATHTGLVFT